MTVRHTRRDALATIAGASVAVTSGAIASTAVAAGADPVVAQVDHVRRLIDFAGTESCNDPAAYLEQVIEPAERRLMAMTPTSPEGIAAMLDFAAWYSLEIFGCAREELCYAEELVLSLIERARAGARAA